MGPLHVGTTSPRGKSVGCDKSFQQRSIPWTVAILYLKNVFKQNSEEEEKY